jgi:hypothetical protein
VFGGGGRLGAGGSLAAQLEGQQPAPGWVVGADAVHLEGADLGHRGGELHHHVAAAGALGGGQYGGDGRQAHEVVALGFDQLAGLPGRVAHRRDELETHRLPQPQRKAAAGQMHLVAGLGAAGQHAHAAPGVAALVEKQKVAARRAAADGRPAAPRARQPQATAPRATARSGASLWSTRSGAPRQRARVASSRWAIGPARNTPPLSSRVSGSGAAVAGAASPSAAGRRRRGAAGRPPGGG